MAKPKRDRCMTCWNMLDSQYSPCPSCDLLCKHCNHPSKEHVSVNFQDVDDVMRIVDICPNSIFKTV
jgi:hypothetical protein